MKTYTESGKTPVGEEEEHPRREYNTEEGTKHAPCTRDEQR